MADRPIPGRSLVTRRAILDIVRGAVLGSYGVTGVDAGWFERLLGRLGLREPGIRVRLDRGIEVDLHLTVGFGVPVAEVARQIDSAVRYAMRHGIDREVRRVTVHVDGLRYQPASLPPRPAEPVAAMSGADEPTDGRSAGQSGDADRPEHREAEANPTTAGRQRGRRRGAKGGDTP